MGLRRTQLEERYELRKILGEGGMGVVYTAFDRLMQREVALKTILDIDSETMAMFDNEWSLLANMVHPNVISIYDIGEFENEGVKKPFFVMPLLPGVTLDRLIRDGSPKLSVTGVLNIMEQACRGLHAAHLQGLVHRDVKPSNIFVMEDNSVKVIDFGLARTASSTETGALRGTYPYMAPEQFARKPPTPLSDLFSLAVVAYQALTRRRPFQGTEDETIEAIQRYNPPPVSALNRDVNYPISMVIAKGMAKQPRHRFLNMIEFAEALQKASRNEPLEWFDSSKVKSRLERAARSFEQGDYTFAAEVLSELEGEGHLDDEIAMLRGQVDGAVRQGRILQLLGSARRFFEATEYTLAQLKIQEALELDPHDADTILLQSQVEKKRRETKISEWLGLARLHLDNLAFRQAREALENLLQLRPNDTAALALLAEVGRQEQELARIREDKAQVYQAARQAWEKGEVTSALSRLELLIAMDRDNPETDTSRSATYQNFFNLVSSEHNALKNAYEEARRKLDADDFTAALTIARQYLSKYPNHALFQALLFDIENRQRQRLSAAIAETDRRVQAERDLDRRMGMLMEALKLFPGEPHFEGALRSVQDKRDLVNSIVAKARFFEDRGQFNEALEQWQILKSIHSEHAELALAIPRLTKRRDQQARDNSRARLLEQITKYLEDGDYDRAMLTAQNALSDFPGEPGFLELQTLVGQNQDRGRKALELLARAQESAEAGSLEQSVGLLREAHRTDPRSTIIRTVLVNSLLDQGRRLVDSDWRAADALLREVLQLEPNCVAAESLVSRIAEYNPKPAQPVEAAQQEDVKTEPRLRSALTIDMPDSAAQAETHSAKLASAKLAAAVVRTDPEPADPPAAAAEPPPPAPVPPPARRKRLSYPELTPATLRKVLYGLVGAAIVLVIMTVVTLATRGSRPKARPPSSTFHVTLLSVGAQIKIDGHPCGRSICDLDLSPGSHKAEAQMPGFLPASKEFTISADKGGPGAIDLPLAAAPPLIVISSDLPYGSILVDGSTVSPIQDGGAEVPMLNAGSHAISVQSGDLQASMNMEVAEGAAPRIILPMQAKGLRLFVVVVSGDQTTLYGSESSIKITLDGQPAGDLAKEGLEWKGLRLGAHELIFSLPTGPPDKLIFESKPSSTVVRVQVSMSRRLSK